MQAQMQKPFWPSTGPLHRSNWPKFGPLSLQNWTQQAESGPTSTGQNTNSTRFEAQHRSIRGQQAQCRPIWSAHDIFGVIQPKSGPSAGPKILVGHLCRDPAHHQGQTGPISGSIQPKLAHETRPIGSNPGPFMQAQMQQPFRPSTGPKGPNSVHYICKSGPVHRPKHKFSPF